MHQIAPANLGAAPVRARPTQRHHNSGQKPGHKAGHKPGQTPVPAPVHVDDMGGFCGYAAVFNARDAGGDIIAPGAFARCITGIRRLPLLWQHDPGEPIGLVCAIQEDGYGLKVRGRLVAGVQRARHIAALLQAGAVDGLSIGYRARNARQDPRTRSRWLLDIDLWEVSFVTFPMQPRARVHPHVPTLMAQNA